MGGNEDVMGLVCESSVLMNPRAYSYSWVSISAPTSYGIEGTHPEWWEDGIEILYG